MTNDATRARAEGLPAITRRLFLRNTAAAGAVAATVAAPVVAEVAASPDLSAREQAIWHIRELERLMIEDGGSKIAIFASGVYGADDHRIIGINYFGESIDVGGMFSLEGGAA